MKDRQLPASFWQQPRRPNANIRLRIGPHQQDVLFETRTALIRIPTPPDTNLLFSLFKILDHHSSTRKVAPPSSAPCSHHATTPTGHPIRSSWSSRNGTRSIRADNRPDIGSPVHRKDAHRFESQRLAANGEEVAANDNDDNDDDHDDVQNHREDEDEFVHKQNGQPPNRPHRLSDDDPYLCVSSKDRRVGLGDVGSTLMRNGDNFSDLLSDLVVNL